MEIILDTKGNKVTITDGTTDDNHLRFIIAHVWIRIMTGEHSHHINCKVCKEASEIYEIYGR